MTTEQRLALMAERGTITVVVTRNRFTLACYRGYSGRVFDISGPTLEGLLDQAERNQFGTKRSSVRIALDMLWFVAGMVIEFIRPFPKDTKTGPTS